MDELIQAMSIKELERFKITYKDNGSIIKIIDGYIETKKREAVAIETKASFIQGIDNLIVGLPHPDDVSNVYMAWREVEVPQGKPEEIEVMVNGNKVREMRQPITKVSKWVVELNKAFQITKGITSTTITPKRAVTVKRRNGDSLVPVGNFHSASRACEYLHLPIAGDSATRVLARNGYIVDTYTGTAFTTS